MNRRAHRRDTTSLAKQRLRLPRHPRASCPWLIARPRAIALISAKLAKAAAALTSLALLLPARSADRKKSLLPFGRRRGGESGLLNAPRLSSFFLTAGLSRRSRRKEGRRMKQARLGGNAAPAEHPVDPRVEDPLAGAAPMREAQRKQTLPAQATAACQ